MEIYLSAPVVLRNKIEAIISNLDSRITQETEAAFTNLISANSSLHIYSLGLYYSAGFWGYITPTFASEEGLEEVSKHYTYRSEADIGTQKAALRWSPCDSPHHAEDELESMMPITNDLLRELTELLDSSDPIFDEYEWPSSFHDDHNLFYKFIAQTHNLLLSVVIGGMNRLWDNPRRNTYFSSNACALTLNAGDLSNEDFLSHTKHLNTPEVYEKIKDEIEESDLADSTIYELDEKKREEDLKNPPTTKLTIDNFQKIIDEFNPAFKEVKGGVFLDSNHDYDLEGSSDCEETFNRVKLMELLERSPHFLEIDKLFGDFVGPQFKSDDLLPKICRMFAKKLGMALIKKYKDKTFHVYMSVDRSSLYFITFVTHRNDGHEFFLSSEDFESGVIESHEFSAKDDFLTVVQ